MKRYVWLILIFFAVAIPVEADEDGDDSERGGYGGGGLKFSQVDGDLGIFLGGYGGFLINPTFMIGGGGYNLVGRDSEVLMGYGGVVLEVMAPSISPINASANVLIGGGNVDFVNVSAHNVLLVEPAVNLEVIVTKRIRIGLGASYRSVTGAGGRNSDLGGASGNLILKFGRF